MSIGDQGGEFLDDEINGYQASENQRRAWAAATAINERLEDLGWVQTDLAKISDVSPTTIRWLQQAETRTYRSSTLSKISKALGWPPSGLGKMLTAGAEAPEPLTDTPPTERVSTGPDRKARSGKIDQLDPEDRAYVDALIDRLLAKDGESE